MLFGESSSWASFPSFVMRRSPSVSISSLPTGNRSFRFASPIREITVGCRLSSVAETTPCGLFSMKYSIPGIGNRLSVHADAGNLRIEFEIGVAGRLQPSTVTRPFRNRLPLPGFWFPSSSRPETCQALSFPPSLPPPSGIIFVLQDTVLTSCKPQRDDRPRRQDTIPCSALSPPRKAEPSLLSDSVLRVRPPNLMSNVSVNSSFFKYMARACDGSNLPFLSSPAEGLS